MGVFGLFKLTYSRGVMPLLSCYVAKKVKEESSLLSLGSGLSLRRHGSQGRSCVRISAKVKPLMLP
ncbi:hypothetical protein NEIG_02578 [Nematocida sp. ERTm5]|nr:hypothetical protein NEIG_02578 [Nematocida sp. ERTm5]